MVKKTPSRENRSSRKKVSSKKSASATRKSGLDNNRIIAAVSLLVILISLIVMVFFVSDIPGDQKPFSRSTIDYDFTVSEEVGFVLDDDMLHFGGGPRGAKLKRGLDINSSRDARVVLSWQGPGNISVDRNNFFVAAKNSSSVIFTLEIPPGISSGNHSGEIYIDLYDSAR